MKWILVVLLPFTASAQINCSRQAFSLPNERLEAGTENRKIPIEHIIVIMQENHTFDNYFAGLAQPEFYGTEVDAANSNHFNLDRSRNKVFLHHAENRCIADPAHDWDTMHRDWNFGKNDGFVKQNDARVMGVYDQRDIPFYYALANRFAISDRYFASTMSQTFPNRFFFLTGTAFGHIKNDLTLPGGYEQKTILDVLYEHGVTWKYYRDGLSYLNLFKTHSKHQDKMAKIADFANDLKTENLPQVSFIDADFDGEDEHPDADIQVGQGFVAARIHELTKSTSWENSVLFLTYDEGGGFFDHVSPPEACVPDNIPAKLSSDNEQGGYDRLGFRVPFVAVSPFAKTHFVSHKTYDHTSILKFIETKFNLPALTARDANADPLLDLFDFEHPNFSVDLPSGRMEDGTVCKASLKASRLF